MRLGFLAMLLLSGFFAAPALAWNATGHRLSAILAWQQLDSTARQNVAHLLAAHPDHEKWTARSKSSDLALNAFLEASTWPDEIRSDPRFYERGEASTPTLPGFSDMERHRDWHYVNHPLSGTLRTSNSTGQLDKRLKVLSAILGDASADIEQRAYALPWLVHLIADAHQPLHVVSRYNREGQSDEGGNRLLVETPFHPRLPSMSLHAYWDDLPGPPWLRSARLEGLAERIAALHPPPAPPGGPQRWIEESREIAQASAYPDATEPVPILTEDFNLRAQAIAQRRIAQAAYRLADLLNRLLGK